MATASEKYKSSLISRRDPATVVAYSIEQGTYSTKCLGLFSGGLDLIDLHPAAEV